MSPALIALLPFLGALLPGVMIRFGRTACALSAAVANLVALVGLLAHAPAVLRGEVIQTRVAWVPSLGLNANFMLDGLGLLFAGLILGMGLLILLYARFYLPERDHTGVFYTCLMLFQGAMTGIVLSDNILLLLVFWELTSLSSFLLIGFWKHLPEGRQGARMALAVTGAGGLAMIAGMLILGQIAGSYDLSVILAQGEAIRASEWYLPAMALILLGCFSKSAQFPFHFWLPHAMAAPTPVSAYLHSATMVKAGIFLMARLWPVLAGSGAWFVTVTTVGVVTMLLGAVIALFKDDLKAVLAYSTVSHLGLITMLLGIGTEAAAVAAVFHIICHAMFKAALFMAAGIVDHAAHTRSIAALGGLRRLMPVTFAIVLVASLSMAGIPPLNGFLSKEMMLAEVAETTLFGVAWLLPALATVAALFSVAYSIRLVTQVFLGPLPDDLHPHEAGVGLWAAPAVLGTLVVGTGLFPMTIAGALVQAAAGAVTGGAPKVDIYLWHGWVPALFLSGIAVAAGLGVLGAHRTLLRLWDNAPRPEAKRMFERGMAAAAGLARRGTYGLHDGSLTRAVAVAAVAVAAAGVWAFAGGDFAPGARRGLPVTPVAAAGWLVLAGASLALVLRHRDRLLALVMVGVVGLIVSLGFAYFSAPDLALTQITVEVVTIVLMLLALGFLPKETPPDSTRARRARDAGIAGVAGLAIGALAWAVLMRDFALPPIAEWHLANAKPGGGGTNAVNVIIVDFRGFDTYGEIIVLGIAALVIFALAEAVLRPGAANDRLMAMRPGAGAADRHPPMLAVAARLILPVAVLVAVYLFLRGHNQPGGGFVAGLVVAIALVLQYVASGFGWAAARKPVEYHAMIGAGIVIAGLTGVGAWANGLPFLTSAYGYVEIWPLEKFELATAMLFDLGVFLTVPGAVMLALSALSRLAVRAGEVANARPFDVDPH